MTARSRTITSIAISWAFFLAQRVAAQERPVARPDPPGQELLQQAEAARLKLLQRADQERRLVRPIPEEKEALKRRAEQQLILERAEALLRVRRDLDDARNEKMLDMIADRVEVLRRAERAGQGSDVRARAAVERVVNSMAFGTADPTSARETFTRTLEIDLAARRHTMGLTPIQESKLRLAAAGDMKRYFDEVAAARENFLAATNDRAAMRKLAGEIRRFQEVSRAGPFGEGSLYAKVLEKMRREREAAEH